MSKQPKPETKTETKVVLKEQVTLRPAFIDEYLEADLNEKTWKHKKEELEKEHGIRDYLKKNPLLDDIYINTIKKKPVFDLEKLQVYLQDCLSSDVYAQCLKKVLDETKLDWLLGQGYITVEDFPEDLYSVPPTQDRLEVPANRQPRKKKT